MTKNLHEPSTPRAVATNRYTGKLTQQKPYAFEWVTPVNDADCAAALADPVTPWTPCYLNDWEQPTTLEPLSVRMSADGNLQWQGYVNSANATAAIAFIMPGTLGGEPDMIPDVSVAENLSYSVFVTPDDGTTILTGRAYVDSTTGEVTITAASGPVALRATYNGPVTIADLTETVILFDTWENEDSSIFGETLSGGDLQKVSLKAQGIYTVSGNGQWDTNFNSPKGVLILDDSGASTAFIQTGNMGNYAPGYDGFSFTYPTTLSVTRKWPLLGVTPGDVVAGVYGRLLMKIVQNSGVNKDLDTAWMDIYYWGPTLTSI